MSQLIKIYNILRSSDSNRSAMMYAKVVYGVKGNSAKELADAMQKKYELR
jgi:hypothetical protein